MNQRDDPSSAHRASTRLKRRLTHKAELDGLRAVAIILVLVYHTPVVAGDPRLGPAWLPGGFIGVDIFMVLSGFLITCLLLQEEDASGTMRVRRFYVRRGLRLVPALYVMLGFYLLYAVVTDLVIERSYLASAFAFASNWHLVWNFSFIPSDTASELGIGHLWSLAVEAQFYLMWPLVALPLIGAKRSVRAALIGLLALVVAIALNRARLHWNGVDALDIYWRTDTRADAFVVGAVASVAWLRADISPRLARTLGWIGAAFLAYCALFRGLVFGDNFYTLGGFTAVAVAAGLVVLAVAHTTWAPNRMLRSRGMVALGVVSYGVYLVHLPVFTEIGRYQRSGEWPTWLRVTTSLALTIALASASWFLVERSVLRLKARRFGSDRATVGAIAAPDQR